MAVSLQDVGTNLALLDDADDRAPREPRKSPVVFDHLTGLTFAVFDALAAQVVPAVEAAHKKALERPNRQRAIGGGDDFDLTTADQVLMTDRGPVPLDYGP